MTLLACLALCSALAAEESPEPLRTIRDVNDFMDKGNPINRGFDTKGVISSIEDIALILEDGTARIWIIYKQSHALSIGQLVRVRGKCLRSQSTDPYVLATNICVVGLTPPTPPRFLPLNELNRVENALLSVATTGRVVSIQSDEVDPRFTILLLRDNAVLIPLLVEKEKFPQSCQYVDAMIRVTGVFHRAIRGVRRHSGPYINGRTIDIIAPAPADPFDIPMLETTPFTAPADIAKLGKRKVCGLVLATWGTSRAMIRQNAMSIVNITLVNNAPIPDVGTRIEAVGYPETDLFRINLRNVQWRTSDESARPADAVHDGTPAFETTEQLFCAPNGLRCFRGDAHGALVRLQGAVRTLPPNAGPVRRFYIDSDGDDVPVDVTTHPEAAAALQIGAEISVTGRWLIEANVPSQFDVFPQISGAALVVRSADDVRVVRNPPWWTPLRCLAAVAGLLAVLVAIVLWNLTLRTLVRKRTQEAYRAQIDRERSDLRVKERTSLAADLHDALSQSLTGISFELKAATLAFRHDRDDGFERLAGASKALQSCRTELKNCIWDLRNDALGQGDMNEAIRRAVLPCLGSADLRIRISIPRTRISDNTAHAILRIIRELVTNAVRHGAARKVRIAGSYDRGFIRFSVYDDGTGFDPAAAPGMAEGHFGLHGIRERLAALNGTLHIESRAEHGTKVTITLQ